MLQMRLASVPDNMARIVTRRRLKMSTSPKRPNASQALIKVPSLESASKNNSQAPGISAAGQPGERHALIAKAAYLLAEQRHFEAGHDVEDWLAAERAIDLERQPGNTPAHSQG
jgi:hypothetical protein